MKINRVRESFRVTVKYYLGSNSYHEYEETFETFEAAYMYGVLKSTTEYDYGDVEPVIRIDPIPNANVA